MLIHSLDLLLESPPEGSAARTSLEVAAHIEFLRALGLVAEADSSLVHPEHSKYFITCLSHYVRRGQPILGDLSKKGKQRWVTVLRALQEGLLGDSPTEPSPNALAPDRRVCVAQAVIVGENSNTRYLLVEHDTRAWDRFKLPGGRENPNRDGAIATINRELNEELQPNFNDIIVLDNADLLDTAATEISRTFGVLTRYLLILFPLKAVRKGTFSYTGERADAFKWMALHDLEWGLAHTPDSFFLQTLGHKDVRRHVATTSVFYEIPDAELSERQALPIATISWR